MKMRLYPSGNTVDPLVPDETAIDVRDIAHSLSLINRFNGHTRWAYSVAQHSLLVCDQMPDAGKLEGLMHDAAECYVHDIMTPLKTTPMFEQYRTLEKAWETAISKVYQLGFSYWHDQIKRADRVALATELKGLVHPSDTVSCEDVVYPALPITLRKLKAETAEHMFLSQFVALQGAR